MDLTPNEAIECISQCIGNECCTPERMAAFKMAVDAIRKEQKRHESSEAGPSHSVRFCPKCQGHSTVYNSRITMKGLIKRNRRCLDCGYKYITLELLYCDAPEEVQDD